MGRKTAERIVVELRDKLAAMEAPEPERGAARGGTPLEADVISALLNLGYDSRVAEKAVKDARPAKKVGRTRALRRCCEPRCNN